MPRLESLGRPVVEVFCDCPPEVAARRFVARRRHDGHQDALTSPQDRTEQLRRVAGTWPGPLGVGPVVTVDTGAEIDEAAVLARVARELARL